jgi:single-stranded-DNA-specific exonuclease
MSAPRYPKWQIAPSLHSGKMDGLSAYPPLVAKLLYARGVQTGEAAEEFLSPQTPSAAPFAMAGVNEAVGTLRSAIRREEPIAVYGDYDADGVTATALMMQTLIALGASVIPYIPHREREGYGLNKAAVEDLAKRGVKLIVTVDCGVRSVDEVTLASKLGMQTIVTDHHGLGEELPPAAAIVNPRRPESRYPFVEFAGVGVAYKLAQALLLVERNQPVRRDRPSVELVPEDLLDLVALGTIADVVPLLGENRHLVREGLKGLNRSERPGVKALMEAARVPRGSVEGWTVGFVLAPRINAAGRMSSARTSYDLLSTPNLEQARLLAGRLSAANRERQVLTEKLVALARERIANSEAALLAAAGTEFKAGVAGLVAGHLTRDHYRPSIVLELGDDLSKASARSIPEFHITRALDQCADLLVRHGGHAEAAGFTVRTSDWPELERRLTEIAGERLAGKALAPSLTVDSEIPIEDANPETLRLLAPLRPFGHLNPTPTFASYGVRVVEEGTVGSRHLRLRLTSDASNDHIWRAIAFRQSEWSGRLPGKIDIAYRMEEDRYTGDGSVQLQIEDIRPSEIG